MFRCIFIISLKHYLYFSSFEFLFRLFIINGVEIQPIGNILMNSKVDRFALILYKRILRWGFFLHWFSLINS